MKAIETAYNKKGIRFALCVDSDKTYSVWRLRRNYSQGRMINTWGYIEQKLNKEAAQKLFDRRVGK